MQNGYIEGSKVASEGLNAADCVSLPHFVTKDQSLEINYLSVLNQISVPFRELWCSYVSYFQWVVSSMSSISLLHFYLQLTLILLLNIFLCLWAVVSRRKTNRESLFPFSSLHPVEGSNKKAYLSILLFFPLRKVGGGDHLLCVWGENTRCPRGPKRAAVYSWSPHGWSFLFGGTPGQLQIQFIPTTFLKGLQEAWNTS